MGQAEILCFLDFDHTLFNTDEFFHVDVRHSLRHLGVDSMSWEESYAQAWQAGYTLEAHAEAICRQSGSQVAFDEMTRVIRDSFADLRRYVFPDVLPFLESAKRKGIRVYLLSHGNPGWQRYKVRGAGIEEYFDDVFFTAAEGAKASVVLEQARSLEKVAMVDNNPSELDLIKAAAPRVETYCMNRVPRELTIPYDESSRFKFFDAREYLRRPWRREHIPCTTLDEVLERSEP